MIGYVKEEGVSLHTTVILCAIGALSARTLWGNDPIGGEAPAVTLPTAVEVMLLRAGLDSEALAAAGVSGATLSARLAAAEDSLTPLPAQLSSADADHADARRRRDRLQRLVQSGQGTQEDVTALAQARADLADAEAARTAVLDAAFAAATEGLGDAQVTTLVRIRANGEWHVPAKYKVSARSQADWIAIRDLLAHVRTYARHEMEPLPEPAARLAGFDGEQAVSSAASNLSTYLTGVESTWDATFTD